MSLLNFAYALGFLGVFIKAAIELRDTVKMINSNDENGYGILPCFYMTVVSKIFCLNFIFFSINQYS